MNDIAFSTFVRRQKPSSEFSHFEGMSEEDVLALVKDNWEKQVPGYRKGVILVPVNPDGFFTPVVLLKEGDLIIGQYKSRHPGEEPRKSTKVVGSKKTPAKAVDVVLYHKDVLAESNQRSTDADWEIISINARPTEEEEPIHPSTLMANHFVLDGGTATEMSDSEFVAALRKSVMYWKDKMLACTEKDQILFKNLFTD